MKEEKREGMFKVGDGATFTLWTDAHAGTIIKAEDKKVIWRRDKAILDPSFKPHFIPGGFCGHVDNQSEQSYTYEEDHNGTVKTFTLRKNGRWLEKGQPLWARGGDLLQGRGEFYDYNF